MRADYDSRIETHKELLRLHRTKKLKPLAHLLLGMAEATGNYSAAEHNLGPKILASNPDAEKRLYKLAQAFLNVTSPHNVPRLIREAQLSYLGIGVGSEASCMMNPKVCWVANTRTIWTHLLISNDDSIDNANEALLLFRDHDAGEMTYGTWEALHRELDTTMTCIGERAERLARAANVKPGRSKYLWADAVANALYEQHHASRPG